MSKDQLNLSQDTSRQRRNLVIISMILIFIELSDVTFGNSLQLFGATLEIGNPKTIHSFLLIFLAYYVWRFYQYFVTDNAYEALLNQFSKYMQVKSSNQIVKVICRNKNVSSLNGQYNYGNLEKLNFSTYSLEAQLPGGYDPKTGKVGGDTFIAEVSRWEIEFLRIINVLTFLFRGRILSDYFLPYLLVIIAFFLQFV